MESYFHSELEDLRIKVLEMAVHAQNAVASACKAVLERDGDLAQKVIDDDTVINMLENEIDAQCLRLLALAQPMAVDLRAIIGMQQISVNLERVGDEAVNIAEKAMFLASRPVLPLVTEMEELADTAKKMLHVAIMAFREGDTLMARDVCRMDQQCNAMDEKLLRDLIRYMKEASASERAVHTIFVSRALERVGDLSTNIAEAVVFIVEGVTIKHQFCQ